MVAAQARAGAGDLFHIGRPDDWQLFMSRKIITDLSAGS